MRVTAERLCLEIGAVVGVDHVLVDDDARAGHETDWTGRHRGRSVAVVRPGSTPEVAEVLRWCAAHDHVVVPQGGNTGLVGGSVPRAEPDDPRPAIVLSSTRLTGLGPVDPATRQVTAGAGVTLASLRDRARSVGLDAPVDFAARDTATIGGAVATNAGGSRVVRFGTMRAQVVGIEAVLASGDVVGDLAGLPKETAGIHWPSLLSGSEGTLAVVTAARLRLVPWYRRTVTALISVASVGDAVRLLAAARDRLRSLDAIELVQPGALALVADHLGVAPPLSVPDDGSVVVVDCADHDDPTDELVALLADPGVPIVDSAVADDPARRETLLAFRDRITEAIAAASTAIGVPTFKSVC